MNTPPPHGTLIGNVLFSTRPFEEYRRNFSLTDDDLSGGPILDCPAGGSDFAATVRARGGQAVSVDPRYAMRLPDLAAMIRREHARVDAWVRSQPDRFIFRDDGSWICAEPWREAAERFVADIGCEGEGRRTGHYIAAALPHLPFADDSFALAMSGFLLFSYADQFDFGFHLQAIRELLRVTRGQVRLHPLNDSAGHPYPRMDELADALTADGAHVLFQDTRSLVDPLNHGTLVVWA